MLSHISWLLLRPFMSLFLFSFFDVSFNRTNFVINHHELFCNVTPSYYERQLLILMSSVSYNEKVLMENLMKNVRVFFVPQLHRVQVVQFSSALQATKQPASYYAQKISENVWAAIFCLLTEFIWMLWEKFRGFDKTWEFSCLPIEVSYSLCVIRQSYSVQQTSEKMKVRFASAI